MVTKPLTSILGLPSRISFPDEFKILFLNQKNKEAYYAEKKTYKNLVKLVRFITYNNTR